MDEARFWTMIDSAWQAVGGKIEARRKLVEGRLSEAEAQELEIALEEVVPALGDALDRLPAEQLLAFDRLLERSLYDIDRAEIHDHTDGSDDGFLYRRGFMVAVGREYYDAVNANPALAREGLECEEICYLPWWLYRERFGKKVPPSGISRESNSNAAGWRRRA
jgi:Protein of unknown function (DUF4240)